VFRALIYISVVGFPIVVILAWFFDVSDKGIAIDLGYADRGDPQFGDRKMDFVVIGLLVVALSLSLYFNVVRSPGFESEPQEFAVQINVFENRTDDELLGALIEARLAMTFGGRIAEELIFGPEEVTTGASNDIQQATNLARRMVTEWGMSDKLGPLRYEENQEEVFLGHSVARSQSVSEATAQLIDEEIRRIIDNAETLAQKVLKEHMDDLHTVTKGLLEYETLSGEEVRALLRGETIDRSGSGDAPAGGPSGRRASVPSSGKAKGSDGEPGGFEPEPQPGS
jgi:hypothetical protein